MAEKIDYSKLIIPDWKDVPGFEGYYKISKNGELFSLPRRTVRPGIRKSAIDRNGYKKVTLSKKCKLHYFTVHRLVALTYIPNPQNLPTVNHKDGNKLNNSIENLEWATYSYQQKHACAIGIKDHFGENHSQHKLKEYQVVEILKLLKLGNLSNKEIGILYNVTGCCINSIKRGRTWPKIDRSQI